MSELARLPFRSERFPAGSGEIVLLGDGRFFVEMDAAMLEEVAAREQSVVERSGRWSAWAAGGFAALAAGALLAGWLAGRLGGRWRERYARKHPASDAKLTCDERGAVRLVYGHGALQPVRLEGRAPSADAAERFCAEFRRLGAGGSAGE